MDVIARCCARRLLRQYRPAAAAIVAQQRRTAWMFRHVHPMPVTHADQDQRHPEDNLNYQVLEVIRDTLVEAPPLKVLLTKYVEGLGNIGDMVTVDGNYARDVLLLDGSAVYPSEANIAKYERLIAADIKAGRLFKLSHTAVPIARKISELVAVVNVSMKTQWTLNATHIKLALRNKGVHISEECVVLPLSSISGPNVQQENMLFRVYVLINQQIVAPLLCRLHHVTPDAAKEIVVLGVEMESPSKKELKKYKIRPESVYAHPKQTLTTEQPEEIWKIMLKRAEKTQKSIF